MKNHTHPEFKGSRHSRKDPVALPVRSKELMKKGQVKRGLAGTGLHTKFLGH
jgi:hypothetical protein